MSVMNLYGERVEKPCAERREPPLTKRQRLLRRNDMWRRFHEEGERGRYGGYTKYTVEELAGLWSVTPKTIYEGIAAAKVNRDHCKLVAEAEESRR